MSTWCIQILQFYTTIRLHTNRIGSSQTRPLKNTWKPSSAPSTLHWRLLATFDLINHFTAAVALMRHRKQYSHSSDAAFFKAVSQLGLHYFLRYLAYGLRFKNTFDLFYDLLSKDLKRRQTPRICFLKDFNILNVKVQCSPKRHF